MNFTIRFAIGLLTFFLITHESLAQEETGAQPAPQPPEVAVTSPTSPEPTLPENLSAEQAYQVGIKSFQEKKYSLARQAFQTTWQMSQENVFALFNWGLSEFYLGNLGMAVAAWRKALFLSPDFGAARQALDYVQETSQIGSFAGAGGHWESFRQSVLSRISVHQSLALTLLCLLFSGWLIVRYFARRAIALEEELPRPPLPTVGLILFALFIASQTLAVLKVFDHMQPRATVIEKTVMVHSAPTDTSSELFELSEGAEVILKRSQEDWSQVRYPGGLTGWVKSQWIFHTSGREI